MLQKVFSALLLAAAAVAAGDCISGSGCANCCPLAQQANTRLSTGNEAPAVSATLRAEFVEAVLANLETI